MQKFVVVIPSYNNAQWCEKNLQSVLSQDYSDYRIIYTDDCSTDNTAELVQNFIDTHKLHDKIEFIKNDTRKGALHNIYDMIHSCEDNEIIVDVDGDDFLAHNRVLSRVNEEYKSGDVWMTHGSYADYPGMTRGCCKPFERQVVDSGNFRRVPWRSSHLRTRYAWLFKKIKKEDLLDSNGNFYNSAWDCAYQFPMLEMSKIKHRYINDILYLYNNNNPISDYKIRLNEQASFDREIRSKTPYKSLAEQ